MVSFRNAMALICHGKYRLFWSKSVKLITSRMYSFIAVRRDKRYGNLSVNQMIPTKYGAQGAYGTQSSDYRCLRKIFRAVPLRADDVFIDVGCGEGRVLTYLHMKGFRGRSIGIELDADVAKTAAMRTSACQNITIRCGNVLELGALFKDASVVYLFHPFTIDVFRQFILLLESVCVNPVRLYYLNSLCAGELQDRKHWTCLSSGIIQRPYCRPMPFSIFQLNHTEQ